MEEERRAEAVADVLRSQLVDDLVRGGYLRSPEWVAAFRRVPRHRFVSDCFVWSDAAGRWELAPDAERTPDEWLACVYRDQVLSTVLDASGAPLSASSRPSTMARFLELLHVRAGQNVLEIGTGTGYNTGLLCQRLGSELVTSVDIDPRLVAVASKALAGCGHRPVLAVSDGAGGHAARAPFARIVATASVPRIPEAWVRQLAAGGVIVTPLSGPLAGGLVALRAGADGSLESKLDARGSGFMALRTDAIGYPHDPKRSELFRLIDAGVDAVERSVTAADLEALEAAGRLVRLRLPHLEWFPVRRAVASRRDGSWARVLVSEDAATSVREGGPGLVWDQLREVFEEWHQLGRPGDERFGLTIRPDGSQHVWLDTPAGGHRWDL